MRVSKGDKERSLFGLVFPSFTRRGNCRAEMLATLRCFSSAPSLGFNHMVTGKRIILSAKRRRLKKPGWMLNCVAGSRATEHRAGSLMRSPETQLGCRAGGSASPPRGVPSSTGGGAGWWVLGWAKHGTEVLHGKPPVFSLLPLKLLFNESTAHTGAGSRSGTCSAGGAERAHRQLQARGCCCLWFRI